MAGNVNCRFRSPAYLGCRVTCCTGINSTGLCRSISGVFTQLVSKVPDNIVNCVEDARSTPYKTQHHYDIKTEMAQTWVLQHFLPVYNSALRQIYCMLWWPVRAVFTSKLHTSKFDIAHFQIPHCTLPNSTLYTSKFHIAHFQIHNNSALSNCSKVCACALHEGATVLLLPLCATLVS